jgi:hypothetical protein
MVTKQKIISTIAVLSLIISVSCVFLSTSVAAQEADNSIGGDQTASEADTTGNTGDGQLQCGDVKTSIIGGSICDRSECGQAEQCDKQNVIFNLLLWVLRIMTAGVGVAAVGGVGYAALLYTTAEGKPDQTKKAIGIITNVVIGIAAYALMAVLLNFIIPGGILQ